MDFLNATLASIGVSLISFVGVLILFKKISKSNFILSGLIAFAAGTLLGDVFWHLLGEQIEEFGFEESTVLFILIGVVSMLLVEAYFHHNDKSEGEENSDNHIKSHHALAKINLISDGIHNFLDGIAIGASFIISPSTGVATTVAVIAHEIPQELADMSVLIYSGWKRKKVLIFNFLTALTAVLGVFFVFGLESISEDVEKYLIPIAIGQFLYISLAALVPEIHKNAGTKKYFFQILMFIVGLGVMYLLKFVE